MKNQKTKELDLTNENVKAIIKESRREMRQSLKETREFKKSMMESGKEIRAMIAESIRKTELLDKRYGGISYNNGRMAEEYFFNTFYRDKTFVKQEFQEIMRNFRCREGEEKIPGCAPEAELDIFLFNGTSAAIIEVKYSAKFDNVDAEKLIARIDIVKRLYPEYQNHIFYLGVAAMSFDANLAKLLRKMGIVTIHHTGKRMVMWDTKAKAF